MSSTARNFLILCIALAAGALLVSLRGVHAESPESSFAGADESTLQGLAEPINDAILRPSVSGVVMEIHVAEGDFVTAGTPLVTLDNRIQMAATQAAQVLTERKAALRSAELAVRRTESLLKRTRTAFDNKAASQFELNAKTNQWQEALTLREAERESLQQAKAQLALEQARLDDMTLRAPFDGSVIQLFTKLGNSVDSKTPAVRIAMHHQLEVQMHLPVALFGRLAKGQEISLRASAPVDARVRGTVRYASPMVDPVSGTFRVVFDIPNPQLKHPAGFQVWLADRIRPSGKPAGPVVNLTSLSGR